MSGPLPPSVYRRRRLAVAAALLVVIALAVAGVASLRGGDGDGTAERAGSTTATTDDPATDGSTGGGAGAAADETTSTTVPTGRFTVAAGDGPVVGQGPLSTYTVEVEEGIDVDADDFAAAVDATLGDRRGWTTADQLSLQRVGRGPATFTVRLATPATTDLLCFPLQTEGSVSCGQNAMAVLNLTRWEEGAEPSGLDLAGYRDYLVSHEVGHVLGHHHVTCPGPGVLTPTMVQQTLDIGPCTPNPWPAPDA